MDNVIDGRMLGVATFAMSAVQLLLLLLLSNNDLHDIML